MNTKDSAGVTASRSGLSAETRRITGKPDGEVLGLEPFAAVISRDGLLGGGDEILWFGASRDGVKLLIKLREFGGLCHDVLVHHEGHLDGIVTAMEEKVEGVADEGLLQENGGAEQKVSAVACDLASSVWIVSTDPPQELIVGQLWLWELWSQIASLGGPLAQHLVVVLCV